jgi:hypothetical protein
MFTRSPISLTVIEQAKSRHEQLVLSKALYFVPKNVTINLADVFYNSKVQDSQEIRYPDVHDVIQYYAGKTTVINASWQIGDYTDRYTRISEINYAMKKGTTVVMAAGNIFSQDAYNTHFVPESSTSAFDITAGALQGINSANLSNIVGNTGIRRYDTWKIADYSFSNPRFVDYFLSGYATDYVFLADKDFVYSTTGTSFAAPELAGYIAQIKDKNPNYNLSQIRVVLEKNSSSIEGKNGQVVDAIMNFDSNIDDSLDAKVLIEDMFEVFQGRNPTDQEVDALVSMSTWDGKKNHQGQYFINSIANSDIILTSVLINADIENKDVPLIDQISGLYHLFLGVDPGNRHLEKWVDYYIRSGEDWGATCNHWMRQNNIKLLGNYDFELNNYDVINLR